MAELEAAGPQVEALVRFNEVPDLGGTLGDDIPERHRLLTSSVRSCTTLEDNVSLEDAPVCPSCLLPLSEEIPQRQATLLLSDLARAMREYNRRISSEGVRRILADPTKEQLEKFITMVQVSDLSTLANVLDDEVVSFLRTFLRPV